MGKVPSGERSKSEGWTFVGGEIPPGRGIRVKGKGESGFIISPFPRGGGGYNHRPQLGSNAGGEKKGLGPPKVGSTTGFVW